MEEAALAIAGALGTEEATEEVLGTEEADVEMEDS